MTEPALAAARASGLVRHGEPLLVLLSGGADSVCLVDVAVRLGARVSALHVNHGLRPEAGADEAHCRTLCERLGVPLAVETAGDLPRAAGNLQAAARDFRYAAAERLAEADYATGHTASDQAETVLYRLAVSPGRRALLGMSPRRGRLVRPLLHATAADTVAHCRAHSLTWRTDPSNRDLRFARARVREEVLPALRALNPEAERGIAETALLLRDEADVLERAVDDVLGRTGAPSASIAVLLAEPPALARLALRRLAEQAFGEPRPLSLADADALLALGRGGGTSSRDLGGGLRGVVEYGVLRFTRAAGGPPPDPVALTVPGSVRFGAWQVAARAARPDETRHDDEAFVAAREIGSSVVVRAWREGDRMRPAGLGGSKSLQDLFTDAKVPRELRRSLPVVEAGNEIAWVAGLAVGERFRAAAGEAEAVALSARRVGA